MKKIYIVILFLLLLVGCSNKYYLSDKIISEIDKNCNENNFIQLSLKEITNFKWDKCVVFETSCDNYKISEALGVKYNGIADLHSGIVFVYDNKIVYEETIPYDPDHPKNFNYLVEKLSGGPTCVVYTYDNAVLKAAKRRIDDRYYYSLTAVE